MPDEIDVATYSKNVDMPAGFDGKPFFFFFLVENR